MGVGFNSFMYSLGRLTAAVKNPTSGPPPPSELATKALPPPPATLRCRHGWSRPRRCRRSIG
jgi:hypothetical protein